jgi:hypothetical protein
MDTLDLGDPLEPIEALVTRVEQHAEQEWDQEQRQPCIDAGVKMFYSLRGWSFGDPAPYCEVCGWLHNPPAACAAD